MEMRERMDPELLLDRKRLELEAELDLMEKRLRLMSGMTWQREYDLYKQLRRFKVLAIETHSREYAEPPLFKRAYPPLLRATVSDWDFELGYSGNYALSTVQFISAPTSLRNQNANIACVVCNYPGSTALASGRVETWYFKAGASYTRSLGFCCRLQYPTWASRYDAYQVVTDGVGTAVAYIREGGTTRRSASIAEPPVNTWFNLRLTWWESGAWLILRFERYYSGAWQNDLGDYPDESPSYTSGVRRCGLYWVGHSTTEFTYTDDTVIYGPPVP